MPYRWNREEPHSLPRAERVRKIALAMWGAVALGILLGLEIAFVEGYRLVGLAIVGIGVLSLTSPIAMTLKARKLRGDQANQR